MNRIIRNLLMVAVFFIITVMSSCGKKSDFDLSLDMGAQSEPVAEEGCEESASPQAMEGQESQNAAPQTTGNEATEELQDGPVFVHICGAVLRPDVYEMPHDARVIDVVKEAGGFTEDADSDYHNLAGGVADGQKIYVPTEKEVEDGLVPAPELNTVYASGNSEDGQATDVEAVSDESDKVNINTATIEELKTLNGIGDKRAQDIIDYRTSNGNFRSIEDIKKVNGIKDGIYNKICDDITV